MRKLMKAVKSIIACVMMGLSAYFGSITLQCVHLWMSVVLPRTWRWYIDFTMYMWISSTVWLMEWLIGIRFRLFGDAIKEDDRAIFIMNHRTRLDWLYFYGVLMRYGWSLCDEKIILKHELKRLPGAGWAMQCGSYMFLRRNLERDKYYLSNMLEYFCSMGHKTKILLFPEGTDLNKYSLEKSNSFALKEGLSSYKYVLHPRTAGFVHLVQEAIRFSKVKGENLSAIYDITVAYPDKTFATNELGFAMGRSSSEVHFLCKRYSLEDIITKEEEVDTTSEEVQSEKLKNFVIKKWEEKEKILENYYSQSKNDANKESVFIDQELYLEPIIVAQWLSFLVIVGNMAICIASLILIPKIFLPIVLILNGIFIYVDVFQHGVDDLAMRLALNDKYRLYKPRKTTVDGNNVDNIDLEVKKSQ